MATVTGSLANASGTAVATVVRFTPTATPAGAAGKVLIGGPVEVDCDEDGAFEAVLGQGYYHVEIEGSAAFRVYVGASATYDLADLMENVPPDVTTDTLRLWSEADGAWKRIKLAGAGSEIGLVILDDE